MENHPLNLAHQQHRRADAHILNNRYDEAMQCHHNAAELLLDAMKSTNSSVALESITLQHSYHLKQKDLIKIKKEQYARVKKAVEHIKTIGKDAQGNIQVNDSSKLQVAIYKTMNESDSLLNILSKKEIDKNTENELGKDVDNINKDVKKTGKTQETVIEELQILSQNLHSLIEQLVLQVEVLKDDKVTLKDRVNYLEKERTKYLNLPSTHPDLIQHNFATMNITNNEVPDAVFRSPIVTTQASNSSNTFTPIERHSQNAHFDLSALKDGP